MEEKLVIDKVILNKIIREMILLSKSNISSKKYNKNELIREFQNIIEREVLIDEN